MVTKDAKTDTYVGGDRFGWGMIGTRALWHNRSKVRGDYSEAYGTGCAVLIRLDMNNGSLRYGLLGGANSSGVGMWGVAFEGLPTHETLYPAVALYQREDQVSISHLQYGPIEPVGLAAASKAITVVKVLVHSSFHLSTPPALPQFLIPI